MNVGSARKADFLSSTAPAAWRYSPRSAASILGMAVIAVCSVLVTYMLVHAVGVRHDGTCEYEQGDQELFHDFSPVPDSKANAVRSLPH
jgi:hypothetical protein